jgi:hypothetical protein
LQINPRNAFGETIANVVCAHVKARSPFSFAMSSNHHRSPRLNAMPDEVKQGRPVKGIRLPEDEICTPGF